MSQKSLTIADDATASPGFSTPGESLIGLILPTLDSTTISFAFSLDDSTYVTVYTNIHGAAPAILNLGTAVTTARVVAVPEEVGRLASVGFLRLVLATQSGGPYTVTALFDKR